jgi:hypothetical protein
VPKGQGHWTLTVGVVLLRWALWNCEKSDLEIEPSAVKFLMYHDLSEESEPLFSLGWPTSKSTSIGIRLPVRPGF